MPAEPQKPSRRVQRQALALLTAAQALVAERSRWTKRAYARDRHGHQVALDSSSGRAVRYCAGAACIRAALDAGLDVVALPGEPLWQAPPALELAFGLLGRACGHVLIPLAGLVYREDPRLAELIVSEQDPALPQISLAELVFVANDLKAVRHRHVLSAFALALELGREQGGRR